MPSCQADGVATAVTTAACDDVLLSSAAVLGIGAGSAAAVGVLYGAVEADGLAVVDCSWVVSFAASAEADGVASCVIAHTPELFEDSDAELGDDPSALPPVPISPPIYIAVDLLGSCSVLPPPLDLS